MRPGVFDVRASVLRLVSALSSELLPTLERPAKAISGTVASGRNCSPGADFRKSIGQQAWLYKRYDLHLSDTHPIKT